MFDDDFDDDAEYNGDASEQDVPVAQPTLPLRTYRVVFDITRDSRLDEIVQAISFVTEGDTVKFYTLRPTGIDRQLLLVNHRTLRPFIDVDDITDLLAPSTEAVN